MGMFLVRRREQKRGYCIMFPVISVAVCAGAVFVVQYLTRRHLLSLSLCEVSQISEPRYHARAHTHSQRRSPVCRKFSRGKQNQRTRAANSASAYSAHLFVKRHALVVAKTHLVFL
jgi:hypothetical protein